MSFSGQYLEGFDYYDDLLDFVGLQSYDDMVKLFKVHVTHPLGKMLDMRCVDTNPISNPFCRSMCLSSNPNIVCRNCYSIDMLYRRRRHCVLPYECNSILLGNFLLPDECLPTKEFGVTSKRIQAVRFNASGELINETHVRNLFNICELNPTKMFSLFFKNQTPLHKVITNEGKPENLVVVYSNPILNDANTSRYIDGRERLPEYVDKIFSVYEPNFLSLMMQRGTPIRVNCRGGSGACRYMCAGGKVGDFSSPAGRCYDVEYARAYVEEMGHPEFVNEIIKPNSQEIFNLPESSAVIDSVRTIDFIVKQKKTRQRFKFIDVSHGVELINHLVYSNFAIA
jgi:hypothetical protein